MFAKSIEIAAATILLMANLAWLEGLRYRGVPRLPTHWGITGKVDGFSPRWFALCLIPALAAGTLALVCILKARQPDGLVPVLGTAITFIGLQLFHFALIRKTLRP